MRNLNPPSIAGNWNFTETSVKDGQQTIYTPVTKTYNSVIIEQNGRFVSSKAGGALTYLGVWKFNCKSGWELYNVENGNDNDTFILTPITLSSKNYVKELEGVNIESGSSKINPSQNLGVGYIKYKRIH